MKTFVLLCLAIFFTVSSYADGTTINGNASVLPGDIETYNVSWESWNTTYQNYANVSWTVTGGTVISSDKTSVTIQWNSLSGYFDGNGEIEVAEDLGSQSAQMGVIIINSVQSPSSFCNGLLGPAKVYVDFGSGTNPGPALPSGTTTYQYSSSCSLNVGEYTVTNNSNNCRSLWHNIASDHTGNTNGYFLMINASNARNEIYRTTVTGLTTSFQYEFSAWVGNLYNTTGAQDPNIRFEIYDITGQLIATSGTIVVPTTIPTFQWQKIGFMFNLPPSVSAVQVVVVNARGNTTTNEGNDMVIDDISFAPCYPGILASFSNSSIVDKEHTCNSGSVNLYSTWPSTIPFTSPSYQWQRSTDNGTSWTNISGATSINYSQTETVAGIYQYRMLTYETSNPAQNITSNNITYYVMQMIVDSKSTNLYTCNGASASGNLPGFYRFLYYDPSIEPVLTYSFNWASSPYIDNLYVLPTSVTLPGAPPPSGNTPIQPVNYNFTLTVTNNNYGCSASNTQTISVLNPRKVGVPSAFAPDGPSPNNLFVPINIEDYPGATFSVWNRWGSQIFYSQGPTKLNYSWDGTYGGVPQPMEVYAWVVYLPGCPTNIYSATNGDGVNYGNVTLVR